MSELHGLQTRVDDIRAAGGEVLAISVDPPDKSAEIAEAYGLSYSVLSDPDLKVIDAYGVRHPDGGIEGHVQKTVRRLIAAKDLGCHRISGQIRVSATDRITYEKLHRE